MTLKHLGVGVALLFTTLLGSGVATAAVPTAATAATSSAQPSSTPVKPTPAKHAAAKHATKHAAVKVAATKKVAAAKKPQLVTLTIRTQPALSNVHLMLDHVQFVTNTAGIGVVTQNHDYAAHTLTLTTTTLVDAGRRYVFARWVGERDPNQVYNAALTGVSMRASYFMTVAFSTQRAVTAAFVDQHGVAIPPNQIESAVARSDTGASVKINPAIPIWLDETKVTYRGGALGLAKVTYSWQNVMVKGSNVLDAGKQAFTPATQSMVTATGQFHDLTVSGSDTVFGSAAGTAATLTYPDGTTQTAAMDSDHQVRFVHLPRGTYQVHLDAGSSIVASHTVRLSRNVVVSVPVISIADIALVVGAALLVMLVVVLAGRRHLVARWIAPMSRTRRLARSG